MSINNTNSGFFTSGVESAKKLINYGEAIDIGCDVMKFGIRKVDDSLAAEDMNGDTVHVTVEEGGAVIENGTLDVNTEISQGKGGVKRASVEVQVEPMVILYNLTSADQTLLIKDTDFADKLSAKAIDRINTKAATCIANKGCRAIAINNDSDINKLFFIGLGIGGNSKIAGQTFGLGDEMALDALAGGLASTTLGAHANAAGLYSANVKNFAGINWSKGGPVGTVTGTSFQSTLYVSAIGDISKVADANGILHDTQTITFNKKPINVTLSGGEKLTPFKIAGVKILNAIYVDTGVEATFTAHYDPSLDAAGTGLVWVLDRLYYSSQVDPRRWCTPIDGTTASNNVVTGILTAGTTYYNPVLMWKQSDFLIAAKGIVPMKSDSATLPTRYAKTSLPWRGTAWSEEGASVDWTRFDTLFGTQMYRGISGAALYIKTTSF